MKKTLLGITLRFLVFSEPTPKLIRNYMTDTQQPHLFGLDNSNRDFTQKNSWGKNQFNSSFPAALCCFLHSIDEKANYLSIYEGSYQCKEISILDAFKIDPLGTDTYFAFESLHTPFQKYVVGQLPRTDLVIQRRSSGECLAGLEVKLTALPDQTTCDLTESKYGSEIVVRPDTIVYLACSIAKNFENQLDMFMDDEINILNWADAELVLPVVPKIIKSLQKISLSMESSQKPFLLQPVWKTNGKSPQLSENCLDAFFWSDAGFTHFITKIADNNPGAIKITRQTRTAIWLYRMLLDISLHGRFNHSQIIDSLSYNTKNDKAFSSAGSTTSKFMSCSRLEKPVVTKDQIKEIILGGGQHLLSPERRFDAIIYNSPELFQQ